MTTSIWSALRERFAAPEWAYFEEVRNGTGWSRSITRTADALAMSLWPSRGLELHGIEVKVGRGDWLREKKEPAKAEAIGQFCERWWLVTTLGVVLSKSEIPTSWGWLEFDGKKLVQKKAPEHQEAKPLDKAMIAGILRKASENFSEAVREAVADSLRTTMAAEREAGKSHADEQRKRFEEAERERHRAERLLGEVAGSLGVDLFERYPHRALAALPEEIAERLRLVAHADLREVRAQLVAATQQLKSAAISARFALRRVGIRVPPMRRAFFSPEPDPTSRDNTLAASAPVPEESAPEATE